MQLKTLLNQASSIPTIAGITRWPNDYNPGSPQQVIAHAKRRASRGRSRPAMRFGVHLDARKALTAAIDFLALEWRQEVESAEAVAATQARRPKKWRAEFRSHEEPTLNFEVVVAEDHAKIVPRSIWNLAILHVKTLRGKGFRGIVRAAGSQMSSETFLGEGPEAYDRAFTHGEKVLDEAIAESDRRMAVQDRVRALMHKGNREAEIMALLISQQR